MKVHGEKFQEILASPQMVKQTQGKKFTQIRKGNDALTQDSKERLVDKERPVTRKTLVTAARTKLC